MPEFSNHVISLFHSRAATEQGGLLSGKDPTEFNPVDPIRLWIIQVGIIICTASLLSLGLNKMRQPKVIAEVLGGIILGPTAFGRIPGFTQHVFPEPSRPYLSLVANIGLCLFLFLVGLEIDSNVIKRNVRLSAMVALAGMILPFGIGAGMAHAVYLEFIDPSIKFTHFMLFTGVAYSITAFPVLCRILTELKLLDTTVGIVVLSAGVGNDIIGWILLALSVALVNASSGVTAVYILLACVGWTLLLLFPVKMALFWLARRTGSIESGPSVFFMTVTMLILFGSAFFTDVIGVHAIFGAFVAGLIVPREGGLAIIITEKLEDMVSIIFLPLYFTLSGLSTDLGLLNDGITWAYTIAIIVTAFIGKFGGCMLAARYFAGFNWRESSTIGSLMSCKGLVELIVLNVGLSAGILSERVFSMFVLEALVLTFMTTPLVTWLYPPHLRRRVAASGANFNHVADDDNEGTKAKYISPQEGQFKTRFLVVLDKLEHVPGMMALTQLIQPPLPPASVHDRKRIATSTTLRDPPSSSQPEPTQGEEHGSKPIVAEALRIIELSDRVSAVMKSSLSDSLLLTDPLLSIFRMFGQLNGIRVAPSLAVVKFDQMAGSVAEHAMNWEADMVLIPWLPPVHDAFSLDVEHHHQQHRPPTTPQPVAMPVSADLRSPPTSHNPFDLLFRSSNLKSASGTATPVGDVSTSVAVTHSQFVRGVFAQSATDVALFVDQSTLDSSSSVIGGGGGGNGYDYQQHVFLPFFGGPDDRLALEFLVQVCANPRVRGTVIRITKSDSVVGIAGASQEGLSEVDGKKMEELNALTVGSRMTGGFPDTVYGQENAETRMQSDTADNLIWARYANANAHSAVASPTTGSDSKSTRSSGSSSSSRLYNNIEFSTLATPMPLHGAIQQASDVVLTPSYTSPPASGPASSLTGTKLIVIAGRSRRLAVENHRKELKELMDDHGHVGSEVRKTIGDVATAFVVAGVGSGVVVLQAAASRGVD